MATHTHPQLPLNALLDFNRSYERPIVMCNLPIQQPVQQILRRSQRLANRLRARAQFDNTMGSNSSSAKSTSSKKRNLSALSWKTVNAALRPKASQPPQEPEPQPESESDSDSDSDSESGPDLSHLAQPSFLDHMTDREQKHALSYYYDHPEEMPHRESGAIRRADDPVPGVLVDFDKSIFSRKLRLRPLPDEDLESVDPFTLDAGEELSTPDPRTLPGMA